MFETIRAIHDALHSESTLVFVIAIALGFGVCAGGVAWIVDLSYKNKLEESRTIKAVSLDCQMAPLPVPFPTNSTIYYMELSEGARSGLSDVRSSALEKSTVWPEGTDRNAGVFAYRCRVANYGDDPIFAISMLFRVSFLETRPTKEFLQGHFPLVSSDVKSFYDHSVSIRVLEPHGGEFVFYIYNSYSPMFVRVTAPVEATYEPATRKERVKLQLKTAAGDAGTITFFPHLPANHKP